MGRSGCAAGQDGRTPKSNSTQPNPGLRADESPCLYMTFVCLFIRQKSKENHRPSLFQLRKLLSREVHGPAPHQARQQGMNCIKIGFPGKLILSKRKVLLEVLFS